MLMSEMMRLNVRVDTNQVGCIPQLAFNLRGVVSMSTEDKMCECGNGGCSACHTRDESPLHFIASGKEIEELYRISLDNDYPEDLWVDPAEADLSDAE
jgi:hypothetical protein